MLEGLYWLRLVLELFLFCLYRLLNRFLGLWLRYFLNFDGFRLRLPLLEFLELSDSVSS